MKELQESGAKEESMDVEVKRGESARVGGIKRKKDEDE